MHSIHLSSMCSDIQFHKYVINRHCRCRYRHVQLQFCCQYCKKTVINLSCILHTHYYLCPTHNSGPTAQREAAALTWSCLCFLPRVSLCKLLIQYHSKFKWDDSSRKQKSEVFHNLPLSDLVKLFWVVDNDLDSHLHFGFLQAEVQAGNLGIDNTLNHSFVKTQNSMLT